MVSRHGLSSALRSLPDQDRAKRMEEKLLRLFDGLDDEGGYGNSPDRKLVSADSEAQLTKLIVLIAHGERKEQIHFALAALTTVQRKPGGRAATDRFLLLLSENGPSAKKWHAAQEELALAFMAEHELYAAIAIPGSSADDSGRA